MPYFHESTITRIYAIMKIVLPEATGIIVNEVLPTWNRTHQRRGFLDGTEILMNSLIPPVAFLAVCIQDEIFQTAYRDFR